MSFNTEVGNLALGHIGVNYEVADLDTEQSREAKAIRRYYETCLASVLRDFPWGFSTKVADLLLIEEDPNTDWLFSYRYPSDCLLARKILSGVNITTKNDTIDFKLSRDVGGRLIMTNQEDAVLEYTMLNTTFSQMPADFKLAFSYALAVLIAPSLTSGDPFKIRKDCQAMYESEMSKAKANSANEETIGPLYDSEFERSRV